MSINLKKPYMNVEYNRLFLDSKNPRFFSDLDTKDEDSLIKEMYDNYNLEELAYSFVSSGYFDEEPLIVVPYYLPSKFNGLSFDEINKDKDYQELIYNSNTEFIVVEGNRRLSAIKILLNKDGIKEKLDADFLFPEITDKEKINDISNPSVIIYPKREFVNDYIAVKHIKGAKKWGVYSKARYINKLIEDMKIKEPNKSVSDLIKIVSDKVGDTSQSIRKIYVCYKIVQQFKNITEFRYNESKNFSYLDVSISSSEWKDFLGIPNNLSTISDYENIIPKNKIDNLKKIFRWYFGVGTEDGTPYINDSRKLNDINKKILKYEKAVEKFDETGDLDVALEYTLENLDYVKKGLSEMSNKFIYLYDKVEELKLNFESKNDEEKQDIKENLGKFELDIKKIYNYLDKVKDSIEKIKSK